jgi:hypothetical protein
MHGASNIKFVIVLFVIKSKWFLPHVSKCMSYIHWQSQKCKLLNDGICKPFAVFHVGFRASDQSRDRALRAFSLLFWETLCQNWKCQSFSSFGVNLSFMWNLFYTVHYSLGYLQFQDADLGSSLGTPTSNVRRLNPIPTALSSASLGTGSSLIDVRDWKTLLSSRDSERSASGLVNRSRTLSPQPFGTVLTPDQISCVANKFRLPSIEGVGKPLLSQRHRFRATASLDNRKLLIEKYQYYTY